MKKNFLIMAGIGIVALLLLRKKSASGKQQKKSMLEKFTDDVVDSIQKTLPEVAADVPPGTNL